MKEIRKNILQTHSISTQVLNKFIDCFEVIRHNKKYVISEPGKQDKYLYFTISGVQKAWYINKGKEDIISFTLPLSFTCAPESFLTQTPSKYYFECITNSEFCRISHNNFSELLSEHKELQVFLNKALMNLVNGITDRFIKHNSYTIEMRFKDFMQKYGYLVNEIPQKDIANYLNINPTNFSKLLNQVKY